MSKATPEQIAKLTELQTKMTNSNDYEKRGYKTLALQILKDIDIESSFYTELNKYGLSDVFIVPIVKNAVDYYSSIKD